MTAALKLEGAVGEAAASVTYVLKKGFEHKCELCGWAGQEVRQTFWDGFIVTQVCTDYDGCAEGVEQALKAELRAEEYAAMGRAEAGLGWS